MGILKNETNHFGIDIGTTGLRAVQLRPGRESMPELVTYGSIQLDEKMVMSDSDQHQQELSQAIADLVKQAGITTKRVVAGLPSDKVFATTVTLPKMSHQELEKSIKYQADQYIPMPIDDAKMDWTILSETDKNIEVLLVAAAINVTERYLAVLEGAGLEVIALEPEGAALARSLGYANDLAIVVLNIGANTTDLVTIQNNTPKLIRSIPIGGSTFVRSAAQNLRLDEQQARDFVYKFGLTQSKLEGQVLKALQSSVDGLMSEIDKSNKFFISKYEETKVEKIIISGHATYLPEFPTYLANAVKLPVEIGNTWNHVSVPTAMREQVNQLNSQFPVATGLALRELL